MTHDPRNWQQGGQEYAPHQVARPSDAHAASGQAQPYSPPHVGEVYQQPGHQAPLQPPQPAMRAAPAGYELAPPPVAAPASQAADDDNLVILSKPYQAHDLQITELRLRKPTGADAVRCGYPLRMVQGEGGEVEYKVVPEAVSKLIVALSSPPVPRSTVDRLEIKDWNACSSMINSFFLG